MNENEFELKVCPVCDAPLPFKPVKISYFNKNGDKKYNNRVIISCNYKYP